MEEERIPQRKKKKRRNYGNRLAFVIAGAVIFAYVFFEIFSAGAVFFCTFWYNTSHIEKTHAQTVHWQ